MPECLVERCRALDPHGVQCSLESGHGTIPDFDLPEIWDHTNENGSWRSLANGGSLHVTHPVVRREIIETRDLTSTEPEDFEPGPVEIRIAALKAAATVYSSLGGIHAGENVLVMARQFETYILETPS